MPVQPTFVQTTTPGASDEDTYNKIAVGTLWIDTSQSPIIGTAICTAVSPIAFGAKQWSGSGAPAAGLGANGDSYHNNTGGALSSNYKKISSAWTTLSVAWAVTEPNLGSSPVWRGVFTITDATITTSSKVVVLQAPGPYTGKGTRADEDEMDRIVAVATPNAGSATVRWQTFPMSGIAIRAGAAYGATRIGKVKGNVKFMYQVAA